MRAILVKMRIAWLAPYPAARLSPPLTLSRRGKDRHACSWILNLSHALATRDDIELHLVTLTAWVPHDQTVSIGGITFHVLKNGIPLLNRGFPSWLPLNLISGFHADAGRLAAEIRKIQPDVVHAHGTEAAYTLGGLKSAFPCLISIQGIVTEYKKTVPSLQSRILSTLEQEQVRRGKYFGCRTSFDSEFVRSLSPGARIFQLQEAMDPVYFEQQWRATDGAGIVFVGSLEERKGVMFLLEAFALVRQSIPAAMLTLVGTGDTRYINGLKVRAKELGLVDHVTFRGHQAAPEIATEHLKAQLFVLPTLNDNSPNTLAEAMVSGMPVIASAVGGIPSMIDDRETGLLVPAKNPRALADAITYLLGHRDERIRVGRNARTVARSRHQPERVAAETSEAYRKIVELEKPGARGLPISEYH
jgi:glycosyltransferase involved in cell wall biosynthesis